MQHKISYSENDMEHKKILNYSHIYKLDDITTTIIILTKITV